MHGEGRFYFRHFERIANGYYLGPVSKRQLNQLLGIVLGGEGDDLELIGMFGNDPKRAITDGTGGAKNAHPATRRLQ